MLHSKFHDFLARVCRLVQVQQERSLRTVNDGREAATSIAAQELRSDGRRSITHSRACNAVAGIITPRSCHCVHMGLQGSFSSPVGKPVSEVTPKEFWLHLGAALVEAESVRCSTRHCENAASTSSCLHHESLHLAVQSAQPRLDVSETWETCPPCRLKAGPRRGCDGEPSKHGLSHEQLPVLVAVARLGATNTAMLVLRTTPMATMRPMPVSDAAWVTGGNVLFRHCARASSVIRRSIDESGIRRALKSYRTHTLDVPQRRLSAYLQPFGRVAKKSLDRYRHSPARTVIATASTAPISRLVNWSIRMSRLTQCGGIGKLVAGSKPKSKALPLTRLDSMKAMQGMHSFFNAEPRFSN